MYGKGKVISLRNRRLVKKFGWIYKILKGILALFKIKLNVKSKKRIYKNKIIG